ncbi:MAG: ribulose-phosphate 3-epimerase [Anaerococcus sp.]|nr:ribulose-phosphate 3-epimerase [Anaerococcus sp.]MDD7043945.1 ribulose-phosphate 3-epimerase [Peptoniphilaceae bacterium]MDY2918665.1 ribulose-phosphate 3-epimerase [Anaerococcus sp.]
MVELSPSILSCNFSRLQEDLDQTKNTRIKMLHIDVMDGLFVPNISFGFKIISDIRDDNDLFFDTHLMIERPERYIEDFKKAGSDRITFHYEATDDVKKVIDLIRQNNMEVGLTLKPKTDPSLLLPYLKDIDLILVMSVEPGFGGQTFMEDSIERIRFFRKYIDDSNLVTKIQVDGGIKTTNVKKVIYAGCDEIVSGSDIFAKDDIRGQIKKYYEIFES